MKPILNQGTLAALEVSRPVRVASPATVRLYVDGEVKISEIFIYAFELAKEEPSSCFGYNMLNSENRLVESETVFNEVVTVKIYRD